ncbi:hypothetical protein, partial [Burkholderia gladioli]|uniref:hypothetical protein n=1 Tax=Burkholderia gladioli TaxID=28095 RepID=UPI00164172C8
LLADDRPVEVEVDSDVNELFVLLKPVDSEPIPVEVDVDNDVMPVDNDAMALPDVDTVVDSESTTELVAKSCEP